MTCFVSLCYPDLWLWAHEVLRDPAAPPPPAARSWSHRHPPHHQRRQHGAEEDRLLRHRRRSGNCCFLCIMWLCVCVCLLVGWWITMIVGHQQKHLENKCTLHRCLQLPIGSRRELILWNCKWADVLRCRTVRAPVFGRHQFFGTSEHYGKAHGSLLSGWMDYNYTACCWFPTSSNILIHPSQFWQIRFESYWLHCSKCRILVLLRYSESTVCAWTNYGPIHKIPIRSISIQMYMFIWTNCGPICMIDRGCISILMHIVAGATKPRISKMLNVQESQKTWRL